MSHVQRRAMAEKVLTVSTARRIDSKQMAGLERASERQLTRGDDNTFSEAALLASQIDNRGMFFFEHIHVM